MFRPSDLGSEPNRRPIDSAGSSGSAGSASDKLVVTQSAHRSRDQRVLWGLRGVGTVSGLIVCLIFVFLLAESWPALSQIGPSRFISDRSWHPAADSASGTFNLLPILWGTVLTSAGAILVAAPLGILSAVFGEFYAPRWLAGALRRMIELMAGVPSVVYGLWGLVVLVPIIGRIQPPGASLLAGIIVLSLMILPTVALFSSAALAAVPRAAIQGATALGISPSTIAFRIAIPAAKSGIATAVLLAVARAIGETMAVLMVCGNVVRIPSSLFDPVRPLTSTIAMEMGYAEGAHRSALFVCGLVLLLLVSCLVAGAEVVSRRGRHVAD